MSGAERKKASPTADRSPAPSSKSKSGKSGEIDVEPPRADSSTPSTENISGKKALRQTTLTPDAIYAIQDFLKRISETDVSGIAKQFDALEKDDNAGFSHDAWTANIKCNRFRKIACLDSTRVVLKNSSSSGSDYINASWVRPVNTDFTYIAAEAPMHNTIENFWQMCYQEEALGVILLCSEAEEGRQECPQFWPDKENSDMTFGNYRIRCRKLLPTAVENTGIKYKLQITCEGQNQKSSGSTRSSSTTRSPKESGKLYLFFFQLTCWPEAALMSANHRSILVTTMRQFRPTNSERVKGAKRPTIVLCSDGCGRTGIAIAAAIAMEKIMRGIPVRLDEVVKELRTMRRHAIRTKAAYLAFVDLVVYYVLSKASGEFFKENRTVRGLWMKCAAFSKNVRTAQL